MEQAISAYEKITVTPEFQEMERLRSRARHNEASALYNAEQRGKAIADAKWQGVVAGKDAKLADKDAKLADKDAELTGKNAELERLRAELAAIKAKG